MKLVQIISFFIVIVFFQHFLYAQKEDVEIVFFEPAVSFTQSLPLGNGRLGAMVYGGTHKERIALNEISLWSGGPQDADKDSAWLYFKPIQNLLLAEKNKEAEDLLQKHFVCKGKGSGSGKGADEEYGCYQTMGDLWINWSDTESRISHYKRTLNLQNANATTSFSKNNNMISESVFVDFVNDVIWIKLQSRKKKAMNFSLSLYRKEHASVHINNNQIVLAGQLKAGTKDGMKFATIAEIKNTEGTIKISDSTIIISNETLCWIKISSATNYDFQTGTLSNDNVEQKAQAYLNKVQHLTFKAAQLQHIAAYQKSFNRCRLNMGDRKPLSARTTEERLIRYCIDSNFSDPQLIPLYFNFGRYLLLCSSRPGLLPSNLQGLWATEYQTPWNGDYHLNINLQMNYWLAEVCNLSQLAEPLHRFTKNLMPNGQKTAKAYYQSDGWVAHVISNPWFYTSPGEKASWGSTLTGGAWLCEHIWEHFRFTQDTSFLAHYYPVLKQAAQFLKNILVEEPKNNWLVTAPSNSPEHAYQLKNGVTVHTCLGPTMDMQIIRELFNACIQAAIILQIDKDFKTDLQTILPRLAPNQIGANGDINEWINDVQDTDPLHRHISHLYGLFPYDEIMLQDTPFVNAAKQTLIQRGDAGTGWSKAWKINFWARLGDGNHALKLIQQLLKPMSNNPPNKQRQEGGTYPNLFCAHPPFQIDGNLGGVAGIAEMLLQSHGAKPILRFLPALPIHRDWQQGEITGLKARGNFEVNIKWRKGQLERVKIISLKGGPCHLLLPANKKIIDKQHRLILSSSKSEKTVNFTTIANGVYFIL